MELMTVSQVSRSLGISTRMLRYYEQAGLVESLRQVGMHTGSTIKRLYCG